MDKSSKYSRFITRLQDSPYLKDDVVSFIFNNIKNIMLSLLPIIAGNIYFKDPQGDPKIIVILIMIILVLIALSLLFLNIFHGWRRISELNLSRWFIFPLAFIYTFAIIFVWSLLMTAKLNGAT